jgi:release factor glutamine methyltransferase
VVSGQELDISFEQTGSAYGDILREFKQTLEKAGMETPDLDARLLVQGLLEISHEELLLNYDRLLAKTEEAFLRKALARRLKHEPVSRIVGMRGFWKSDFKITAQTLDPRPDSETLIEAALHWVPKENNEKPRVLDMGTGSGCLLLSLLLEWPQAVGIGIDINPGAVRAAIANERLLGLRKRVAFQAMDWEDYKPRGRCDVLISNPPYIAEHERDSLAPEVLDYDPPEALFAGADGLDAYRSLARLAPRWLKAGGLAFYEIGHMQAAAVKELLAAHGQTVLETRQDLAGRDRVIVARLAK